MPRYTVNATLNVPAAVDIEADNEKAAEDIAATYSASQFEYDIHSADVEFNVTPAVEVA